jgi:LysM repeat protein/biopolymer transport protein ExbD
MKKLLFTISTIFVLGITHSALAETVPHHIAPADNLFRISLKYSTTVAEILTANPGLRANSVKAGQTIVVPTNTRKRDPELVASLLNKTTGEEIEDTKEELLDALFSRGLEPKTVHNTPSKNVAKGNINLPVLTTATQVEKEEEVQFVSIDDLAGISNVKKNSATQFESAELQQRYQELKKIEAEQGNIKVVDMNTIKVDASVYSQTLDKINSAITENKGLVVNLQVVLKDGSMMTISNPDEQKRFLNQIIASEPR